MNQFPKKEILQSYHPLLYLITDRVLQRVTRSRASEIDLQLEIIKNAVDVGCRLVQVRERDLSALDLAKFVDQVLEITRPRGAFVLVNDRLDVALATGADGVHLRSTSLKPSQVRRVTGACGADDFLIGASTHAVEEIVTREGADFYVFGPVFETSSKAKFGEPLGLDRLARAVKATNSPVFGIGGMTTGNFQSVLDAGAAGIAAIGLFSDPDAVAENVATLLGRGASRKRQ